MSGTALTRPDLDQNGTANHPLFSVKTGLRRTAAFSTQREVIQARAGARVIKPEFHKASQGVSLYAD